MTRRYPEEPAGEFPTPPRTMVDGDGREVTVQWYDPKDCDALVAMYESFDPADRAQGIPPVETASIRDWLENLVTPESVNVVVEHDEDLVGHAILVPDREDAYELAIFVLREYQGAGVGTALLEGLLGAAQDQGIEKVWLTVERWNKAAVGLYQKLGFEPSNAESFEMEMAIRLRDDESE